MKNINNMTKKEMAEIIMRQNEIIQNQNEIIDDFKADREEQKRRWRERKKADKYRIWYLAINYIYNGGKSAFSGEMGDLELEHLCEIYDGGASDLNNMWITTKSENYAKYNARRFGGNGVTPEMQNAFAKWIHFLNKYIIKNEKGKKDLDFNKIKMEILQITGLEMDDFQAVYYPKRK